MKLFAVDTSAKTVSAAVLEDDRLITQVTLHTRLTHSETLLPICADLLKNARLTLDDIDGFAAGIGPGSFTGLRIGISAIKGFAYAKHKPCAGVSSLEGLAWNHLDKEGILCAVTDARKDDAYCACFLPQGGRLLRLTEDSAIHLSALSGFLEPFAGRRVFLIGDGAGMAYQALEKREQVTLISEPQRLQQAYGVGLAAFWKNRWIDAKELMPVYIRLPQAQRERLARLQKEQNADQSE